MPQLVNVKFAPEEMPRLYDPAGLEDLQPEEFIVAEREAGEDVGFVAGIEWLSSEQLQLKPRPERRVLRRATDAEKDAFFLRKAAERKALVLCKEVSAQLRLPIKVTQSRINAADGRIIFHFTSDQRVDFRQLVREMSARLKTRVELWQLGVRDEAKKVDGFGVCGLRTCCSAWLPDFRPISIRLAKDQDISLPPSKLSGLCGRLLCCLSYEADQYREAGRKLLPKGATVEINGKKGVIIDRNILLGRYTLKMEDGPYQVVEATEMGGVRIPDQMKKMADVARERAAAGTGTGEADGLGDAPAQRPAPPRDKPPRERDRDRDRSRRADAPKPASPKPVPTKPAAEGTDGEPSPMDTDSASRRRRRGRRRGGKPEGEAAQAGPDARPPRQAPPPREPREGGDAPASGDDAGSKRAKRRGRRGGRRNRGKGGDGGGGGEGGGE